jgi:N-acyl-L-homoserine lactone synthetase
MARDRDGAMAVPPTAGVLDGLVARVLETYPYRFTVLVTEQDRAIAYRLRWAALVDAGWAPAGARPDGLERDRYDAAAVHILGWDGDRAVCTGRLVLPPGPLPTEQACGVTVPPQGRVVDVGRMCVVRDHQTFRHAAFLALLCRLYLEMRARGYEVACGMMSARVRTLVRQLGLELETLGEDREHDGEPRAPVRFALTVNTRPLQNRWEESAGPDAAPPGATALPGKARPARGRR